MLTTRAAKWVVKQIGAARPSRISAAELGCCWDAINAAVRIYGAALLAADTKRLKETTAIGLDETLFVRAGPYKQKTWSTTVCDVANHALIDVLATRDFTQVAGWLRRQPHHVKANLEYGCLDMSKTYNAVFKVVTPKATRVIDRFHVMRHAILAVDQIRRRVQQQRLGHRGRAADPLYRARKLLVIKATATDPELTSRLESLLALGDPDGEVAFAYSVKEAVARFYDTARSPSRRPTCCATSSTTAPKRSAPPEVRTLARTLSNWFEPIVAWHRGQGLQRSDRGHEQPLETGQARGLRLHQLRELPHPGPALRGQAQLQGARLDRGGLTWLTPLKPEEPETGRADHSCLHR